MLHAFGPRRALAGLALALVIGLIAPAVVTAHAELESSTPADASTLPSTFDGPIVLTFSAALADGSKADLLGPDGAVVASAVVDGPGATMTIAIEATLEATLAPGQYEVRWVSVGDDGDLERGTIAFTIAPAPASPSPTATAATTATVSPASAAASAAPATPPPAASPSVSPADGGGGSSSADVILPILVVLIVVGAGAVYLVGRRNRATPTR